MKAHASRRAVRAELDRITDELYAEFAHGVGYQTLATVYCVLHREYGFDAEMLRQLNRNVEDEFHLMDMGVFGKEYNTSDCVKFCNECGIDFNTTQFKAGET